MKGVRRPRIWLALGAVVLVAGAGLVWTLRDGGPPATQRLGDVVVERLWTLGLTDPDTGVDDHTEPGVLEVAGDTAYLSVRERLRAIDLATGRQRWEIDTEKIPRGLDVANGAVAVTLADENGNEAELALIDAGTGAWRWAGVRPEEALAPVIAGDVVVVPANVSAGFPPSGPGLQAFDLVTGEARWTRPQALDHPCWDGSRLVTLWRGDLAETSARGLAALSAADGEPISVHRFTAEGGFSVHSLTCSDQAVAAAIGSDVEDEEYVSVHRPGSLEPWWTVPHGQSVRIDGTALIVDTVEGVDDASHHTLFGYATDDPGRPWTYRTPAEYLDDDVQYVPVAGTVVVAYNPGDIEDGGQRGFTRLLDERGRLLGELAADIDEPSELDADPAGDIFVIGDDEQLVGLRIRPARG